ncbi:MAG: CDP-glucose 4,6-dehydratase [Bacteroidetes bacterium]|nr:CDP-glucose 4,6-dehydratase [Bacteroidota bacterium]
MESLVNQKSLEKFYKGKKVFVTGHTGFKGAWLISWLHLLGAEIKGYSLAPQNEICLYNIVSAQIPHTSVIADIRNKEKLKTEIEKFQPDFIFHLAAQALVRRSYENPSETFDTNVLGTTNLLNSLITYTPKCTVLIVTTDKVYENREKFISYKETDRLGGFDPYSASKACAEIATGSFINSFFPKDKYKKHKKIILTARAGNVIGGGDWSEDRIIPDIVNHLKMKKKIPVRNPQAIRPWQHVLEPLGAYLLSAGLMNSHPGKYGRSFNFGPQKNDHITVKKLVEIAINCWGEGDWENVNNKNQPHEAGILQLDINLAKKELNWKPKLKSKEAIQWTIDWYRQNTDQYNFTIAQIKKYALL